MAKHPVACTIALDKTVCEISPRNAAMISARSGIATDYIPDLHANLVSKWDFSQTPKYLLAFLSLSFVTALECVSREPKLCLVICVPFCEGTAVVVDQHTVVGLAIPSKHIGVLEVQLLVSSIGIERGR
jgi:hypothetical protein